MLDDQRTREYEVDSTRSDNTIQLESPTIFIDLALVKDGDVAKSMTESIFDPITLERSSEPSLKNGCSSLSQIPTLTQ